LLICELDHPEISVSEITLLGAGQCTIDGVDSSRTTVRTSQTVDVGPPQVQVSGTGYVRGGNSGGGSLGVRADAVRERKLSVLMMGRAWAGVMMLKS